MKAIFSIFLMVALSGLALSGQAPEKRFVGNCSFSGFALLSDSTYRGDIVNFTDRFGDGYNLNQLAAGYEILDGRGLVFEVDTIHSATNFTADVSVTAKVDRGFAPFGSGQAYNPTENGLIPPSSQEQAGLSPTQKARVDRHNVVVMQSLIGGRDSVYSIASVPDTSGLSPVLGDAFVNATADTLGLYDGAGWVLFFGGSQSADGLTILGDGTGGDPFRVDTGLVATRNYADSLFEEASVLIDSLDNIVLYANMPAYVPVPPCEDDVAMVITGLIIDKTISIGDNISGDITFSGAPLAITYVQEENGYAYFEATGSAVEPDIYAPEIEYAGITLSGLLNVVASNPDTVTVFDPPGQDSILVTRVCGAEIARDTIVSDPIPLNYLSTDGAAPLDAIRISPVSGEWEPYPINAPEFVDSTGIEFTVCNDGSCDYETPNQAFKAASLLIPAYDSVSIAAIKIRIKNNADSSPSVFTETSQIIQGDFSNVTLVSDDTVYYDGSGAAFYFSTCIPPKIDSLRLRGQNNDTYGLYYFSTSGKTRIYNSYVDSFRIQLYNLFGDIDVQKCNFVNGRGTNAGNIWLENTRGYMLNVDCSYTDASGGANAGCFRSIGASDIWLRNFTAKNDPAGGANNYIFRGLRGTFLLSGIFIDSLTSETVHSDYSARIIYIHDPVNNPTELIPADITFMPVNRLVDNGSFNIINEPYPFQESTTADAPDPASGIRYYYNLDSMAVMVTHDNATWERLVSSGTITGSGTTNRIPVFAGVQELGNSYLLQAADALTLDADKMLTITGGTTAARPTATTGGLWYNQDDSYPEWSDGISWRPYGFWAKNGTSIYYDDGNVGVGTGSSPATKVEVRTDNIGTTQDVAYGLSLRNTTSAAAGAQQMSPGILWEGQGWKTNTTAGSQSVRFLVDVLPIQGPAASGEWTLKGATHTGGYTTILRASNTGNIAHNVGDFQQNTASQSIVAGNSGGLKIRADGFRLYGNSGGSGIWAIDYVAGFSNYYLGHRFTVLSSNVFNGGNSSLVNLSASFAPTSDSYTHAHLWVRPTINQTGTATGITRGVHIDPTLTAADDFRGLEISNTTHKGLWQTGAAVTNYLNGPTGIGVTAPTSRFHLPGGTAPAGTSSLKIEEGVNTTTPEDGAINHVADRLNFTSGSTVNVIAHLSDITDDQTASEVNITDAGGFYTGTTVEAALQEVGGNPGANLATDDVPRWDGSEFQPSGITSDGSTLVDILGEYPFIPFYGAPDAGADGYVLLYDDVEGGIILSDLEGYLPLNLAANEELFANGFNAVINDNIGFTIKDGDGIAIFGVSNSNIAATVPQLVFDANDGSSTWGHTGGESFFQITAGGEAVVNSNSIGLRAEWDSTNPLLTLHDTDIVLPNTGESTSSTDRPLVLDSGDAIRYKETCRARLTETTPTALSADASYRHVKSLTSANLSNFTATDSTLTYTGTETILVEIQYTGSIQYDESTFGTYGTAFRVFVGASGYVESSAESIIITDAEEDWIVPVAGSLWVSLNPSDVVSLRALVTAGITVNLRNLNFTVKSL